MRTLWISLTIFGATAAAQAIVVWMQRAHDAFVAAEQSLVVAIPCLTSAVIHPDPHVTPGRSHDR